ncbi:MAG: SEL1-like repeat protein [Clostridia bacterium]|nr:SEL1-like repeat protein [Clostridia bacterium]
MNDIKGTVANVALGAAELAAKLSGVAFDFMMGIGCEAFCEVLDVGKDFLFEAIKSGKIDLKTKKALENLDQRTIDDLKLFVSKELEKYGKKGKMPKKLKGKDLTDLFMNRLETVSSLVNRYAEQNKLSEERKIALKYILNEIRQCTAQASLDMLENEDKRLVLVISQIVRNTFEDYHEDFAPQLAGALFCRPTNCTYCASPNLMYDDHNNVARCKNCGMTVQYEKNAQPDMLKEMKQAFKGELVQVNTRLGELYELGMQTLNAVEMINGRIESSTRNNELKSRLSIAQDRISNYEFSDAMNTCRSILKDYPDSVDALWCYLQAEFGIVYLRGYNESVSKPTFCYPMDQASKSRFCDHPYYKKIMELLKKRPEQRTVYEARQREIDKAIATVKNDLSKKSEYDVFICVKIGLATENNQVVDVGMKTMDFEQYAQRIYRELTSRGLRVFCSQITQAQGIAYDEQIWSAMLRSKKILVIGTRREYLESVWVQCEWRRWLYLKHIGVRGRDSLVALIPSEDEWSYIRPREWDEQRITVYTDIDGALEALLDKPAAAPAPVQGASQNRQIRDVRVLLDLDPDDTSEAEERLRPLLKATPSNGELRWLALRIKSKNFTDLKKITQQEINLANRCLKDDGLKPEDNPEYQLYMESKNAPAAEAAVTTAPAVQPPQTPKPAAPKPAESKPAAQAPTPAAPAVQAPASATTDAQSGAADDLFAQLRKKLQAASQTQQTDTPAPQPAPQPAPAPQTDAQTLGGWQASADLFAQLQKKLQGAQQQPAQQQNPMDEPPADPPATGAARAAEWYDEGESYFYEKKYSDAIRCYKLAAEQGHAAAQYSLGYCYRNGYGVTKSDKEAAKWYKLAAENGDADAQCGLGYMYENGIGVGKNLSEAIRLYRLSAEQGDKIAQTNLGLSYANGRGVTKSHTEAIKWYRKAADQKHPRAQNLIGDCYYFGNGVNQSYPEAMKWYKLAADQGYADAQYNMGYCYRYGKGVSKNHPEAVKWFRLAADQGHAGAQNKLGDCYYYGEGVSQSYAEAVKLYRPAADSGNALAQYNLGYCYRNGRGVAQNNQEAARLYKLAADQGNADAQCGLGYLYENGLGVGKSMTEATKWYRKSAEQGNNAARCNLGYCYEEGTGVTQSYTEAVKWYRAAAAESYARAQNNLGDCYYYGHGVEQNAYEAVRLYKLAADQGYKSAQYNLGYCYEYGKGVQKNHAEAIRLLQLAADQGSQSAKDLLAKIR